MRLGVMRREVVGVLMSVVDRVHFYNDATLVANKIVPKVVLIVHSFAYCFVYNFWYLYNVLSI